MSDQFLSEAHPKARKEYDCIWCREKISIGESHVVQTGIFEGDFYCSRFHKECLVISNEFCRGEIDNSFEPHAHKRGSVEEI